MAAAGRLGIVGVGSTTSLGASTRQLCAALRAGLSRFGESEDFSCMPLDDVGGDLEPALVAPARNVDPAASGLDRLLALTAPALAEAALDAALRREDFARATLHLVLPAASRPGLAGIEEKFVPELCKRAALPAPAAATASRAGNSGFAEALRAALRATADDEAALAIVIGVDSLLDSATMKWLDAAGRLKSSRSPEGVIAGEAAAVCVLERRRAAESRGAKPRAMLDAVGVGQDPATVANRKPWTGDGMCAAMRSASARLEPPRPPWVLTDMNGDRSRGQDWGYVTSRMHELLRGLRDTWYIADMLGDVGVAAGGILAARAAAAFEREYAPSSAAYLLLSSDDGGRGAIVLSSPRGGGA
jgi:3-oxoacyl-[acyl-carrier-protein] synthase-1